MLKKVSKDIVNDDAKKKLNQKSKKTEASENLFNKQITEFLELDKKIYGIKG